MNGKSKVHLIKDFLISIIAYISIEKIYIVSIDFLHAVLQLISIKWYIHPLDFGC